MNIYSIITGDIVGFSKLNVKDKDLLIGGLYETVNKINSQKDEHEKIKIEIYRGDSFQVIIPQVQESLKIALLIRLGLISARFNSSSSSSKKESIWDARLSIGIGAIDYIKGTLSLSDGEAFHYSGRAFDMLKKSDRLTIRTPWENVNRELDVECFMADTIIRRLSDKQAGITYQYLLENNTQKSLAKEIGVTPQAVNKSLLQGGNALHEFIKRFEILIKNSNYEH